MGTNYYAVKKTNKCDCCGRADESRIHIGKKSWGWAFSFRGWANGDYCEDINDSQTIHKDLLSWRTWKEFLDPANGWDVYDEYDEPIPVWKFKEMVEGSGSPNYIREDGHKNLVHNVEIRNDPKYMQYESDRREYNDPLIHWEDEFGYSFSTREFS